MLKLARFLKPYTLAIIFLIILVFTQTMCDLKLPDLMSEIVDKGLTRVDYVFDEQTNTMKTVPNPDKDLIFKTGGIMLLITLAAGVATVIVSFLASRISIGAGASIRKAVFTHIEKFTRFEMNKFGTASLINRTTNDIVQVQTTLFMMFRMVLGAPITFVGGIIMATGKSTSLAMNLVYIIPILIIVITLVARKAMRLFREQQGRLDKLNNIARENITGVRAIRAYNRMEYEENRFDVSNKNLVENSLKVNRLMSVLMPLIMLIMNITIASVIWVGAGQIDMGHIQAGDIIAFIQYSFQILFSFMMFAMMFVLIPRAAASADRINEVLRTEPSIKEPEDILKEKKRFDKEPDDVDMKKRSDKDEEAELSKPSLRAHGLRGSRLGLASDLLSSASSSLSSSSPKSDVVSDLKGNLEFRNVTFSYPGAEAPALKNISFKLEQGKTTAVIGGTGSGKSTLIHLIMRFYDTTEGEVLLNGVNIKEISTQELRKSLGYVPQKSLLFSGTIEENIKFGKQDATDEEVRIAAEVAQAAEFIEETKDKFKSPISQGGSNVSGGQRQRLSIARALVRKPEIYVFDDSFSALDFKTDAKLREALKTYTKESSMLIIAQRVSTIMNSDQIIVLHDGEIAGIGKHEELLKNCEVYQETVYSQLSKEELA